MVIGHSLLLLLVSLSQILQALTQENLINSEALERKPFIYTLGKRDVSDEVDKRKSFLLGKRPSFQFGKRDDENEDEKRAKFQFGKRNDDSDEGGEKRKFQFGKRNEGDMNEVSKKKFQFGKREETPDEVIDKKKFQFGKREDDGDQNVDKKKFQFGKRKFQFGKRGDSIENIEDDKRRFQFGKRKFQFGKRYDDSDIDKRPTFQFGKRTEGGDGDKRKFQFGKRSEEETEIDEKRKFQFGKRRFQFGKKSFQFGKRDSEEVNDSETPMAYNENPEKRPFGSSSYRIDKRSVDYIPEYDKRPFGSHSFQFGKRYYNDDMENYSDIEKRPFGASSFKFGKRTYDRQDQWQPVGLFVHNIKRHPSRNYQESALMRNNRKFLLGKRIGEDNIYELSRDLKRKVLLGKKRAFGSNNYHWNSGITDFSSLNEDPALEYSDVSTEIEKRPFGGGVNNLFG